MKSSTWLKAALCLLAFSFGANSFAQNRNLIEEEKVKDRERDKIVKEIEEQRKSEEELLLQGALTDEELEEQKLVEVEYNNILPTELTNVSVLVPYKVRRKTWGSQFTVSYVVLNPDSYDPEYSAGFFEDVYGSAGMIEGTYDVKYNLRIGSFAAQAGIGVLNASAQDGTGSSINLMQYRLGLKYTMDNLFYEPIIAPYVGGGAYMMSYKEELAGDSVNGTTDPALYVIFGALFQMDWIDKRAAVEAYTEGGIENTFLFIEARNYFSSSAAQDPDFSTELSLSGGLSLEF